MMHDAWALYSFFVNYHFLLYYNVITFVSVYCKKY